MPVSFADHLAAIQARTRSNLALLLRPKLLRMPLPMQRFDDPFLPFGKAIIDATRDMACAYVVDLAAYLAPGAAGAVALERTLAYAGAGGDVVTILHGPFASADYAEAAGESGFDVDAVTITSEQFIEAYTANPARAAFVVRQGEAPVIVPLPGSAGIYWQDADRMTILTPDARTLHIRVAGERALYAGRGDDFAERVRAALEAMRA